MLTFRLRDAESTSTNGYKLSNNKFVKKWNLGGYACLFGLTVNISGVVGQVAMQK